jgi:hypothetical protein
MPARMACAGIPTVIRTTATTTTQLCPSPLVQLHVFVFVFVISQRALTLRDRAGNASEFGYKLACRKKEYIRLESGDVLIWGGPNRMLLHCVRTVYADTAPKFLPQELHNVRLNFTFRDAPNVVGREKDFKYSVENTYERLLPHMITAHSPAPASSSP